MPTVQYDGKSYEIDVKEQTDERISVNIDATFRRGSNADVIVTRKRAKPSATLKKYSQSQGTSCGIAYKTHTKVITMDAEMLITFVNVFNSFMARIDAPFRADLPTVMRVQSEYETCVDE